MTRDVRPASASRSVRWHRGLGLRVEVRRGLVEDDDVGCLEQEAGEGHPLLFPTREPITPFADHGVEAIGEVADQVADLGLLQGLEDLRLRRLGTGVEKVGPQRVVEEVRVLGDHAHDVATEAMVACRTSMPLRATEPVVTS